MWGNGSNFNQDDAERQQRLAAAAAQMSQQLQEQQRPQHPLNYSNSAAAADFFNANAYQSYQQDMASSMILEERRRLEMALAANVLQDQENVHVRDAQLRQAQIRAAYERELASSLAASDQFADLRRNLLEHQLSTTGRDMNSALHQDFRNQMSSQLEHLERRPSSSVGSGTSARDSYPAGAPSSFGGMRTEGAMDSLAFVNGSVDATSCSSSSPPSPIPRHNDSKHSPGAEMPSAVNKVALEEERTVHTTKAEVNDTTMASSEVLSPKQEPDAAGKVQPKIESTPTSGAPASPDKQKKKKSTPTSSNAKKGSAKKTPSDKKRSKSPAPPLDTGIHPHLSVSCGEITPEEYTNLQQLMEQFCKVPLLAEFSRPVSLLHPELIPLYKKVVQNPIDLGKVCRAIRKRQYVNKRQVCVDVWRIFANCVKYHTHPITREGAIPSFISIASHLREYFNALWLEYMVPSEIPKMEGTGKTDSSHTALLNAEVKRIKVRSERQNSIASVVLSSKLIEKTSNAMIKFIEAEGRVDALDKAPIWENSDDELEMRAINAVFSALSCMASRLREIADGEYEYTVESLTSDLKRCYGDEIFEGMPSLKVKFAKRLDRMLGKLIVPINEVSCRGINQSSVWGCMAAAIWARENTKKPYWPALVLGIMAPNDQREDWHLHLTQRNEARLPEKLQVGLQSGKKKAIQAIQKQNEGKAERMSYFLVEFLGTHEFIWVREADIIENFDPEQDVNQQLASAGNITKKKKSAIRGQTAANARMLQKATDEGRWALEEFEMLLNDPCGDQMEDFANEEEEENYTFPVLCESDDEADEADDSPSTANHCRYHI
jgi:Bromodomain.